MVFYIAIYSSVYCFAMDPVYGILQMAVVLAIPILWMYNGKRGRNSKPNTFMKYAFYIYYPLHLFVLGWLQAV